MTNKQVILIIEDEKNIGNYIETIIISNGYKALRAMNGMSGLSLCTSHHPDLILLDLGLPDIDGSEVLERVRGFSAVPVIVISARTQEAEKVQALDQGADDYITKPFSIKELLARVSSVLRRYNINKENVENILTVGSLNVNLLKHEVFKGNEKIDLTLKEFELLKLLLESKGKVLSRNYLLDKIWGYDYYGETRTVDVHIRYLRKKIEGDNSSEKYIQTIRGVGYKID